MRRLPLSILLLALGVPSYSGEPRLPLAAPGPAVIETRRVPLSDADHALRTAGALRFLGGVQLTSPDPAFGGYSAMTITGDRLTLLSDGGGIARFRLDAKGRVSDPVLSDLADGPGTGWAKRQRDTESMARMPNGDLLVGFEYWNAVCRYTHDLARLIRCAAPAAMADWSLNGGAEALAVLPDGRVAVFSETAYTPRIKGIEALMFAGDPTTGRRPAFRFGIRVPVEWKMTDAVALDRDRIVILLRRVTPGGGFVGRVAIIQTASIGPNAAVVPHSLATLETPLLHDNYEGLALVRESGRVVLWVLSDDNLSPFQRTLLLKFAIEPAALTLRASPSSQSRALSGERGATDRPPKS